METVKQPEHNKSSVPPKLVSFWLDAYENIFSDFDPRSFSQRGLSADFLNEVKTLIDPENVERLKVMFLIPVNKRSSSNEHVIRTRLKNFFTHEFKKAQAKKKAIMKKGLSMFFVGVILMALAVFVSLNKDGDLMSMILRVIFEPAGWFIAWYGLDNIFISLNKRLRELSFYRLMSEAEIDFETYKPEGNL